MNRLIILLAIGVATISCTNPINDAYSLVEKNQVQPFYLSEDADPLIEWALNELAADVEAITGKRPIASRVNQSPEAEDRLIVGLYSDLLIQNACGAFAAELSGEWEKFIIRKTANGLCIAGSDVRGVVYGIFELAERIGVSPWKWWADVLPDKADRIAINIPAEGIISSPSVQYRGVFLNDEDWGLHPWAAGTFEPETGDIGPRTYEKVFQLLLRLKANTIWPAMHPCTGAFYSIPGNKEMAIKYHIIIGTSHAEPMLRNNVGEWNEKDRGPFNYFTNRKQINQYWQERIAEARDQENGFIATVGMRGVHDSGMEGGGSNEERVIMLEKIIQTQRTMLEATLGKTAETIPQAFVPYKEVLDLYDAGLKIPDDVTLIWTDDNYGYIRRLSSDAERKRQGGAGVYYHLSYWGRPHDYLWLSSMQPSLIWFEMSRAYHNGAQKIWIANVGDIKPAEYNMEFFLDLAWDIHSVNEDNIQNHLKEWAAREFGSNNAEDIAALMDEYYRLAFLRKPEFMGWSQTEPTTPTRLTDFSATDNGNELQRRIDAHRALENKTEEIKSNIEEADRDAYFQLVEYAVKGAAYMNYKFLYAQMAAAEKDPMKREKLINLSKQAYDGISNITRYYNEEMSDGKWKGMMSMEPRGLPVFQSPEKHFNDISQIDVKQNATQRAKPVFIQAGEMKHSGGSGVYAWKPVDGLGYSGSAITLFPLDHTRFAGDNRPYVEYEFKIDAPGEYNIEVRSLPTHANDFDHQAAIQVDDQEPARFHLNTRGRSEEWKTNVLRNHQSSIYPAILKQGTHRLRVSVNQTGIVIDQIGVYPKDMEFYEFQPTQGMR